jgi:glyoxalase family protein
MPFRRRTRRRFEPGNVLFDTATVQSGFLPDENLVRLGHSLMLPPREEPHRADIEAALVPIGS